MVVCPRSSWTYFQVDFAGEEQGGAGVLQIVKARAAGQPGTFEQFSKDRLVRFVGLMRLPGLRGEDEAVVLPLVRLAHPLVQS